MLNVDLKIISKAILEKLKKINQTSSLDNTHRWKNRNTGVSWRLISNVIEVAKIKNQNVFLVIVDTEKAFDSFDHNFLIFTLENYGFGKNVKDLV